VAAESGGGSTGGESRHQVRIVRCDGASGHRSFTGSSDKLAVRRGGGAASVVGEGWCQRGGDG
jgi:hypothetical protein